MSLFQPLGWALCLMSLATSALAAPQKSTQSFSAEDLTFFLKEVRPILQNNCALCHDSGKRTSGFSVESRELVLAGGNRGPAAEPGKPEQSRFIQAIRFSGELKMPPTGKLADKDIAVLERWVTLGLPAPSSIAGKKGTPGASATHWSFQPIQRPPEPNVKNMAWAHNPIDRFVLARLEKEGFAPSSEANRSRLIRRLSLEFV